MSIKNQPFTKKGVRQMPVKYLEDRLHYTKNPKVKAKCREELLRRKFRLPAVAGLQPLLRPNLEGLGKKTLVKGPALLDVAKGAHSPFRAVEEYVTGITINDIEV